MEQIKPIETIYNGYRFRSRLEARWAVFFDAAGIKYEYEPEGFKRQNGMCYLPDFYLPDENIYVEVKANRPGCWKELKKSMSFIGQDIPCLLVLSDIPDPAATLWMFPVLYYHPVNQAILIRHCPFLYGYEGPWVTLERTGPEPGGEISTRYDATVYADEEDVVNSIIRPHAEHSGSIIYAYYGISEEHFEKSFVNECLLKARRARFEHGEKG